MRRLSLFYETLATATLRALIWGSAQLNGRRAGQGLVEYGLILVLIMVVCVAILSMVGKTLSTVWYTKLVPAIP